MMSKHGQEKNLGTHLPRKHYPFESSFEDEILREGEVML
jgi:hypothetical protein